MAPTQFFHGQKNTSSKCGTKPVVHSSFNGDAPLIGSVALIVDKIFNGELKIEELERLG